MIEARRSKPADAVYLRQRINKVLDEQDCTCSDEDSDGYCWYHMTPDEQVERVRNILGLPAGVFLHALTAVIRQEVEARNI